MFDRPPYSTLLKASKLVNRLTGQSSHPWPYPEIIMAQAPLNPRRRSFTSGQRPESAAVILGMTKQGEVNPTWEVDERQWVIEDFLRNISNRTVSKSTKAGFYSAPLKRSPGSINVVLLYAVIGVKGTPWVWNVRPWYQPLIDFDDIRDEIFQLEIGGLQYGLWIFKNASYSHEHLVRVAAAGGAVIAPRVIRVSMTFQEVKGDIRAGTDLRAINTALGFEA